MEITYKKINNSQLFKNFENSELLNMTDCQNYIPIYNSFFKLNNNNFNSINLNNEHALYSLTEKRNENIFEGTIKNESDEIITKSVFFKLSPLLDPFKYLAGKYDINNLRVLSRNIAINNLSEKINVMPIALTNEDIAFIKLEQNNSIEGSAHNIFNENKSEYENMIENDYLRIFDAGNKVLIFNINII